MSASNAGVSSIPVARCSLSRERMLSHLLKSSFATAPLILPACRCRVVSLVKRSISPLFMPDSWWRAEGEARGRSIDVHSYLCTGELRASRLSFYFKASTLVCSLSFQPNDYVVAKFDFNPRRYGRELRPSFIRLQCFITSEG